MATVSTKPALDSALWCSDMTSRTPNPIPADTRPPTHTRCSIASRIATSARWGIPCCVGYHAAWDTVLRGIPCCVGYHAAWDTVLRGIPCCSGYHSRRSDCVAPPPPALDMCRAALATCCVYAHSRALRAHALRHAWPKPSAIDPPDARPRSHVQY